jgi:hypothetical protein
MFQNSPGMFLPDSDSSGQEIRVLIPAKACDKDGVLMQKILEAGPGGDAKVIQRQLLELGEIPNR